MSLRYALGQLAAPRLIACPVSVVSSRVLYPAARLSAPDAWLYDTVLNLCDSDGTPGGGGGGAHLGTHCDTPGARISHSGELPPPGG